MSLPVYQELPCQLDDKGNGSVSFTPFVTYGTASVILSVTGAILTGQGYISLGNNPLGPCALAQGFGPFNVQYGQPVNIVITGGPPNALLQLALKGAIYIPGESTPGENLQFSAVTQQNSNVLVFKQNIALTGTVIYGPFEVSKFAGLNLVCEVNGQAQAVLSWTDVNGVTPLGASQWDMAKDLTGNGVYKVMDVAANLGPKVTLEIVPNGATEIASVSLVPSSTPLIGPSGTTLNAVAQISATVADGANATGQPSFVAAGPAVLSLVNEFDGKSWELQVFYVKADQSTHLIVSHIGTSKDYQVGISLPSAPCVVKYYNNAGDGTSQQVEVQLIKSSKGTGVGLPGPQGPQGPSGGGSLTTSDGVLGSDTPIVGGTVMSTASLAAGTWLINFLLTATSSLNSQVTAWLSGGTLAGAITAVLALNNTTQSVMLNALCVLAAPGSVDLVALVGSVLFSDNFNRADGPVGNGWQYLTGFTNPTITSDALTGCPAGSAIQMTNALGGTPDSVQLQTLGSVPSGGYVHLFCGSTGLTTGPSQTQTGVSVSQGQSGDYAIWTWSAGVATQRAIHITAPATGVMQLTKSGNVYTGSINGVNQVTWTDSGSVASWGAFGGMFLGGGSGSAGPAIDNFSAGTGGTATANAVIDGNPATGYTALKVA